MNYTREQFYKSKGLRLFLLQGVIMKYLKSKEFWSAALIRALKTFAQTAIATIGTAVVMEEVNWIAVASASVLAALLSLLTSLGGLPEVGEDDE